MKFSRALALLVAATFALTACVQAEEEPVATVAPEVEVEEEVVDIPRHPLTGFELAGATVTGPSIGIKIDNTAAGRPAVGITAADMVYEELVEDGVTRYLAVFHTEIPDEVGPVRSGRPQDAGLVISLGGVFVTSGVGNNNVREIIRATGLHIVEHGPAAPEDGKFFSRSNRKVAPWNLHIDAAGLAQTHAALAPPAQQFNFSTDPTLSSAVVDGEDASAIRVNFSAGVQSNWEWDAPTQTYLKVLANGLPDVDASGTQISATNILIFTPNYFDVESLPTASISGTQESLFVATGGKLVRGLFDATAVGDPIVLTYGEEDKPVLLAPGKTFILLPPGAGSQARGVTAGKVLYVRDGKEITRDI